MTLIPEPAVHRWTRDEYYAIAQAGLFADRRVELIAGQVIDMAAMGSRHSTAVLLVNEALRQIFGSGYVIRIQMPLAFDPFSEPEPDIAVVTGAVRDYATAHPTSAILIVEVADSSLAYDRTLKASLYAAAYIADYWIVNLVDRQIEVYRNPQIDSIQPFGYGYTQTLVYTGTDTLLPLAVPHSTLVAADLLP